MTADVRRPGGAGHREREALDARNQPGRVGSDPSVRRACRRRGRRARRHGARLSPAVRDVGITVGAGRDAHRPALRPPTRPARVLSELRPRRASGSWSQLAQQTLKPPARPRGRRPLRASDHRRERSGLNARRATTRPPGPAAFIASRSRNATSTLRSFGRLSPRSPPSMAPSSPSSVSVNSSWACGADRGCGSAPAASHRPTDGRRGPAARSFPARWPGLACGQPGGLQRAAEAGELSPDRPVGNPRAG
jgi:hypothetical protein